MLTKLRFVHIVVWLTLLFGLVLISACSHRDTMVLDRLNKKAYDLRYRNLDSMSVYVARSLALAHRDGLDSAECLNNKAFVCIAKMQYPEAKKILNTIEEHSNNQVELLVADVQMMRLCQRESMNKDFYKYREQAVGRIRRINNSPDILTPHEQERLAYARSEFSIVESTYFYYVGLTEQSIKSLHAIDPDGDIQQDTSQLLCYWYNVGAGSIITRGTPEDIALTEFDYLIRCYVVSSEQNYPFWKAQALQSMSEHLQKPEFRKLLIENNLSIIGLINTDKMPDSLLAGNLAQRAYQIFKSYGDVYQIAGANRTLASCYWYIHDYRSALICLKRALYEYPAISQAPDLVASIREQLSLVYSAVNDKISSDRNRNIYLDLQEQTRQDRQLEARASQLNHASRQLNVMLIAVIIMIVLFIALLIIFDTMRRRSDARFNLEQLLVPLKKWQSNNEEQTAIVQEQYDELQEQTGIVSLHLQENRRRNMEQRAKIQLVNSVIPFIDRMVNEVKRLQDRDESEAVKQQRYQYIMELTDSINDYNSVLTQWIQMRQGEVRLKIESFALQSLFDIVSRAKMSFRMKGIDLHVHATDAVVKADKTLTLFMINTMADNARKFTPQGGTVDIAATEEADYVEIGISDNGCGMSEEEMRHIFDRAYTGGHGFGLKNCMGIIEKYKKISRIFQVCELKVDSVVGKGTRFSFRLPKGITRLLLIIVMLTFGWSGLSKVYADEVVNNHHIFVERYRKGETPALQRLNVKAARFADSAYYANIKGHYLSTLRFADSCHQYLTPADTAILLDISNETAIAALALHRWNLYEQSNKLYTRLFREVSADNYLPEYVVRMQKSRSNKAVAVILLIILLVIIFPAYYFLYYRHRLNYRFCIDRINAMNRLLFKEVPDETKLAGIDKLGDFDSFNLSDDQQSNLKLIVSQIRNALKASIEQSSLQKTSIELAEDEMRRIQMDNYQLHVSNSILDNCLSTLKHETMYYPSRISHLIDGTDQHLTVISELASYYKELYQILSLQAVRQLLPLHMNEDMAVYLFELLRKLNHNELPRYEMVKCNDTYMDINAEMTHLQLSDAQCRELFTPYTCDLKYLICKQIVRDFGELTNLRACGLMATANEEQRVTITITLPIRQLKTYLPKIKGLNGILEETVQASSTDTHKTTKI